MVELEALILEDYDLNGKATSPRVLQSFHHLSPYFGRVPVSHAYQLVPGYVTMRRAQGAKNATINVELAALRRSLRLAVRAGRLAALPEIPTLRTRNIRQGFFTEQEIDSVMAYMPEPERAVVAFAYITGWRKSEILGLQWSNVRFDSKVVRLEPNTTKNSEGRTFPFGELPALLSIIERQRRKTLDAETRLGVKVPWVFHRDGVRIRYMDKPWRAACKRAGTEGRLFHDLRRTAARNLERAGVSRSVAMKLLGHKTQSIFFRYAIPDLSDLRAGARRLAHLNHTEEQEIPLDG